MQAFQPPFLVKPGTNGTGRAAGLDQASLPGAVTRERDPQAVFGTESLAQALRQLEVYGRDGLPVLSADGQQVAGWGTNTSVLRAVAREIRSSQEETAEAQAAADWDHDTAASTAEAPPSPLPGYRVIEITIADGSAAAGTKLGDITWPPDWVPVSLLRNRSLRQPDPKTVLDAGDRVNLLARGPA